MLMAICAAPIRGEDLQSSAGLPGKGPSQHPFLYAGEWDTGKPLEQSIFMVQAVRLHNGNTLIAGDNDTTHWPGTMQVLEVTPEKKVVWALSSWKDPDLGPATSIQLLDEPGVVENLDQQR